MGALERLAKAFQSMWTRPRIPGLKQPTAVPPSTSHPAVGAFQVQDVKTTVEKLVDEETIVASATKIHAKFKPFEGFTSIIIGTTAIVVGAGISHLSGKETAKQHAEQLASESETRGLLKEQIVETKKQTDVLNELITRVERIESKQGISSDPVISAMGEHFKKADIVMPVEKSAPTTVKTNITPSPKSPEMPVDEAGNVKPPEWPGGMLPSMEDFTEVAEFESWVIIAVISGSLIVIGHFLNRLNSFRSATKVNDWDRTETAMLEFEATFRTIVFGVPVVVTLLVLWHALVENNLDPVLIVVLFLWVGFLFSYLIYYYFKKRAGNRPKRT